MFPIIIKIDSFCILKGLIIIFSRTCVEVVAYLLQSEESFAMIFDPNQNILTFMQNSNRLLLLFFFFKSRAIYFYNT